MTTPSNLLELHLAGSEYGLSARRLWEHTDMGQINPFDRAISARRELNDAAAFIDVVRFDGDTFSLTGATLAELKTGCTPANSSPQQIVVLRDCIHAKDGAAFIGAVASHLAECSIRQAVRNQHHQFLPTAQSDDVFCVPHIFSTLQQRLRGMGNSKAGGEQWIKTIENFQKKGLRAEELDCSNLIPDLSLAHDDDEQFSAIELAKLCDFKELRISVIPVISDAQQQLRFTSSTVKKLNRTKNLPKALASAPRSVFRFDAVLGYHIDEVEQESLWGTDKSWQAVTFKGAVIRNRSGRTGFQTVEAAIALANDHAKMHYPKRMALGRFNHLAWTGGQDYREWLITLPYLPASYLSGHFKVRNVLAHVRCDVRQGADDERVLMLQEVQSDWAQRARRAASVGVMKADDEVPPPFMKEWSALVMKLMLLHAAYHELDAVAWTRGAQQVHRWNGLGAAGLIELYDRTLPKEVNRIMKHLGGACEPLGVFVPTNFSIKQTENGYEVYSPNNELLGIAPTLEDARVFVPDQGHELLFDVHGVRLPVATRKTILDSGFPAWG